MVSWNDVAAWVSSGAAESEVLEFKARFWEDRPGRPAGEELAKDVAGLLNHRGGTIVVGVGESGGAASGFSGAELKENAEQRVQQALDKHLAPQTAAGSVSVYRLGGESRGAERSVLVVEVRAWPHGPVAVRGEGAVYRIPRRRGAHTEDIPWEDAMRDLTATHRRNWLRFTEWREKAGNVGISVASEVRVLTVDGLYLAVPPLADEPLAELHAVEPDVVTLRMVRTAYAIFIAQLKALGAQGLAQDAGGRKFLAVMEGLGGPQAWADQRERPLLSVPFELIKAAWLESSPTGARLQLLLGGDLAFAYGRWGIRPT